MSQLANSRALWTGSARPARARLSAAVDALTRARRVQNLVDYGFGGLLAGLCIATFLVLVNRFVAPAYASWELAGAAVAAAMAAALLLGWLRRPDALNIAIRADLALNLKQRLSTAWEYAAGHGDRDLSERLAVQAVKAGLPVHPGRVFPLRINRWGRLSPLAAAALLFVSVIDISWMQAAAPREVDEQVVSEGQRLGAFGRAMQERARRDQLPRSARQATQLERLGARMESGAMGRGEALAQLHGMGESLNQERKQALAEGNATDIGPLHEQGGARGVPDGDTRALTERLADLARSGASPRDLEDTLKRQMPADSKELREMLDKLAQIDRARRESDELENAREQVRLAQENLGDSPGTSDRQRDLALSLDWDEEEGRDEQSAPNPGANERRGNNAPRGRAKSGSKGDSSAALDRQHAPVRSDGGESGPVVKPESQARTGDVFVTQARVLPRPTRPDVENMAMSREFASQVEEVLSKDEYPAHYKEFVRRYFLKLSEGRAPEQQPTDKRGEQ